MKLTAENLSKWMSEAVDEATEDLRAEITQLRAELAESRASEHGLFGRLETCRQDEAKLKAELEKERELADRIASDAKNLIRWFIANLGENNGELDDIQESLSAHTDRRCGGAGGALVERWHEELHGMAAGKALYEGQQEYVRYEDCVALSSSAEAAEADAEALAGGIKCLQAICDTPIGRRKMNIESQDERLVEARFALAAHEARKAGN